MDTTCAENISLDQAADAMAWRVLDIESMLQELENLERKLHCEPSPKNDDVNSIPSDTILGKLRQLHYRLDRVSNMLNSRVVFMRRITAGGVSNSCEAKPA